MRQEPLRLGLIGCGAIAGAYVQAMSTVKEGKLAAVADTRAEAARALGEQVGCPAYESHEALLDAGDCEAVLVCTPPASHRSIVLDAIRHGMHVLCEKPLSVDSSGAREMLQAARDRGVTLSMSSKFRYVEDVIQAKSLVAAGTLGEVILFENTFASRVDMTSRWNSDPEVSGGGVLIDNGTHSVDLMRYFLGPVTEVHAVQGRRIQKLPVEDTARIFIRSADGVMGSIDLSWSLDKATSSYVDIYGSQGTLRIGWKESRYRQTGSSDWIAFGRGYDKLEAFRRLIDDFCQAARGSGSSLITAEDALASVEVVEAVYDSLRANHWVPVNGKQSEPTVSERRPAPPGLA